MKILGLRLGHSAAASITIDGKIVANVMEERFTRIKNDGSFPENAIKYCLKKAGINSPELDAVAMPNLYPLPQMFAFFPKKGDYRINYNIPGTKKTYEKLAVENYDRGRIPQLAKYIERFPLNDKCEFYCIDHHLAHASSAYYTSGFNDDALIFTLDGVGDKISGTVSKGSQGKIERLVEFDDTASLGWFYSAVTEALDWRHGSDEWKVMGLAPYGNPVDGLLSGLYPVFSDGHLKKGVDVRGVYRWPDHGTNHYHLGISDEISNRVASVDRKDVAAEVQRIAEEQLFNIVLPWIERTGIKKAAFAGGFFLNVKANQKLWYTGTMDEQWIYPDPGDSGLPVGCCLMAEAMTSQFEPARLDNLYHGPEFTNEEIADVLKIRGLQAEYHDEIDQATAEQLANNKIVGWFQGRMEAGPRALGNRSILMSPIDPSNKDIINGKVKFREAFRPFCPSMIQDVKDSYFIDARDEFFMISSFKVKDDKVDKIPAVVHVDGTARPQMVTSKINPLYYSLIKKFGDLTGHPVLLNTSFNVKGEPIVCTPRDAIRCFYDNGLDVLILGNYMIKK